MKLKNQITIAIPAHNEEEMIYKTLTNVFKSHETPTNLQVVICLSNCTDNTKLEIEKYTKRHPKHKIQIISLVQKGKALAMKYLDSYINDRIIVFLDADCVPSKGAIKKIYEGLLKCDDSIVLVSGNSIDIRYVKSNSPNNLVEIINHVFWQHPPRRIINGQFFAIRKGFIQLLPNDVKLDDVYLSTILWRNFTKDNDAITYQGSPQKLSEIIRYQKNIQSGKKQIYNIFKNTANEIYKQFNVEFKDRKDYYNNLSWIQIMTNNFILAIGKYWGYFSKPAWDKTVGSKIVEIGNN